MDRKNLFLMLLILGTAFWGISFPIVKLAIGQFSSSTFLFYRFLTASLVLSLIFAGQFKKTDWKSVKVGISLAIPLTFGIYMQTLGIRHTSASQCAFVAGMCVVIVPVLKMIFYKDNVPIKVWLAALVALAGLFVICIKENFSVNIGDLYTLTGALGFAIYLIKVEHHSKNLNVITTIVPMFTTCTLITAFLSIIHSNADWMPQSNIFWMGIAYCALFSTAYMYTISNLCQRYLSAERVSIIYLFEPIFGAVAAFFILGEILSWRLVLGGSLIFAATLISELKLSKFSLLLKRSL
jgi:drug/metabolite transporter (DMT)-like permease